MSLLSTLKQKITGTPKTQTVNSPVYMEKGAQFVCQDHVNKTNMSTTIVARHVEKNTEDFPKFQVIKTSALDGMYGMNRKVVLNLDTDYTPTAGSINLITSGDLYRVISELQSQIDELKDLIKR